MTAARQHNLTACLAILCAARRSTGLASPWIRPNVQEILGPIAPATLRRYQLPPDVAAGGWSAQLVTRTAKSLAEGTDLRLAPKNAREHFVDDRRVDIPLPELRSPGLGIELLEVEGGRDDGLGITIVTGLVPGGNAARALGAADSDAAPMYGDAIAAAELTLLKTGGQTDIISTNTECLGYDATVEALVAMLGRIGGESAIQSASVTLTLKRLLRRPDLRVEVQYPPDQGLAPATLRLQAGDNLRLTLLQQGIKLNDPLAQRYDGKESGGNCGGGALCRTCAVAVQRGGELLSRPKQNEEKMLRGMGGARWRLACKSWVGYGMQEGDIVVQVNPRQW